MLLGRVGGTKSWLRDWSSGGLDGPGDTGFDAVVMIEANSIVALSSSSCIDWVRSVLGSRVSSVRGSVWSSPRNTEPAGIDMTFFSSSLPSFFLFKYSGKDIGV